LDAKSISTSTTTEDAQASNAIIVLCLLSRLSLSLQSPSLFL